MHLKPAHLKRYGSLTRLFLKYGRTAASAAQEQFPEELAVTDPEAAATGEALAKDLETLGPTFIKLGQLLSSRGGMLPPEYAEALERLQDSVAPFPLEEVERIVTEELGVRLSKGFQSFEAEPLASASLGQVHRARLRDGREVVVKVQRPHIRQQIRDDLDAFEEVAKLLEQHSALGQRLDLRALLEEFRQAIYQELDYRREAQNLERLAGQLAGFTHLVVPRPIPDYTSSRVLTMEYVPGRKITEAGPLTPLEVDGEALVEELFQAYLQQILVDGFFHSDPHPGNVILTPDNRIALIDLGQTARLSPRLMDGLLKLVLAVADGRGDEAADRALELSEQLEGVREGEFRRQVAALVAEYTGNPPGSRPIGKVFIDLVRIAGDSGVRLPPEIGLLGKTLYSLEAVGRAIAPAFDPTESVRRNSAKLLRQRMLKSLSPGNLFSSALELRDFTDRLPSRLNRILDAAATNQLRVGIDTGIDAPRFMLGVQKVANRITMGLVLAGLIVGAALLMRVETEFRIFGYPGLAIVLFLLAVAGGVVLLLHSATKDWHEPTDTR